MKKNSLKNRLAFTMIELVFVIIMVGILSAAIIPSMQSSRLREAADQIVSHIRYTQHLAMIDDKFDPAGGTWYKKRWQILFEQNGDLWAYTIFSDNVVIDGNPEEEEIARNPQDTSKRLTGGSTFGGIDSDDKIITKDLNIGRTYGITGVDGIKFNNFCGNVGANRIVFDYIGRPMGGNPFNYIRSYQNANLITSMAPLCTITITDNSGDSLDITIEPETGFARII
ncbi:MAG: type II secretion system GspH family protein [Campylobacteraceae bacterium]|jgi:type II secretory pathway pseudopilin PulG|nr:type II secretion system GspH family protein [Campylobacteraceae bacterium]